MDVAVNAQTCGRMDECCMDGMDAAWMDGWYGCMDVACMDAGMDGRYI